MTSAQGSVPSGLSEDVLTYVQISDSLMMSGAADAKWIDDYYASVYISMPGYKKPTHYMELPLWISKISGMVQKSYDQNIHVVVDIEESIEQIRRLAGPITVFGHRIKFSPSQKPYRAFTVQADPHGRTRKSG